MTTTSATNDARRIVSKGVDIRARMHDLAVRALEGSLDREKLSTTIAQVMSGVGDSLGEVIPEQRGNVLRQVFDGLADAGASAAEAAQQSIEHARSRGRRFTKGELTHLMERLKTLEHSFLNAVGDAKDALADQARREWDDLTREARRAGTNIAPAAQSALKAADGHALDLAKETAKAGLKAAKSLAGDVAMGVSGLLSGVGEKLKKKTTKAGARASTRTKNAPKSTRKKATKRSAAKPAARTAASRRRAAR
jgi:hypothetical protein